jgi:CubicO group peptidase (beta-lactamase class C family)
VLLRGGFEHGYGQGLCVHVLTDPSMMNGVGTVGEISGAGGHGTYFWCDLNRDLVACLMLQLSFNPYPIHQEFRAELLQALTA